MAKDDFHVIVYQILSYLYQRLKRGEDVDPRQISVESDFFHINKRYWSYIMVNLLKMGLIGGIIPLNIDNAEPTVTGIDRCYITPAGIEYLTENSTVAKAKQFFKEAKDFIVPFL